MEKVRAAQSNDPGAAVLHVHVLHHGGCVQQGAQPLHLRDLPASSRHRSPLAFGILP